MTTVLVTGANRGIGLEFCRQYKKLGAKVVAVCRRVSPELASLQEEVIEGADISRAEGRALVFDRLSRFGTKIDVLVNNAGVARDESLGAMSEDTILEQFQVNAVAPLCLTDQLLPHLQGSAKVCLISSRMGSIADNTSGGRYGYRMSKAALNMAAVSLAQDLFSRGIAVGVFHPGFVKTEMTSGRGLLTAEESVTGLIEQIRSLKPREKIALVHTNGDHLPW